MSAEDRVRTAAEATAASVRQIRPLTLPDNSQFAAEPREHGSPTAPQLGGNLRKFKETWLIPLGAAAAVAALALSLVALRHTEARSTAPTQATAGAAVTGIPRYYAIATEGPESHIGQQAAIDVTVADVYTGKKLTTVALPAVEVGGNNAVAGVSAAADDRTFVIGRRNVYGGVTYFQVRVAPGTKRVATVEQLPIPEPELGNLLGFAVSPDGKKLAVLSVRGNGTTLRVYSVTSGATLRTWTAGPWQYQGDGVQQTGVSWTADSRQVAFATAIGGTTYNGVLEERLIGATAPSGNLATASELVFRAHGNCSSLLLTPDGGTVVCATLINYPPATSIDPQPGSPGVCGMDGPAFLAYSAATGKLARVLYQYAGTCGSGEFTVLWSDGSARHVIGESQTTSTDSPPQHFDQYGVAAAGNFAKFQVAKHGQWYGGPAF